MKSFRHFLRQILGTVLHVGFFAFLSLTIFKFAFENPQIIKESIAGANTYEKFVISVADSNKAQLKLSEEDSQKLRVLALKTYSPQDLQIQTERVIDSLYSWLNGTSKDFSFTVDLTDNRQAFGEGLVELVMDKLAFLPICEKQPETIDPFTATCRPEVLNYNEEKQNLATQLLSSPDFLGGMVFSETTVSGKDGKSISQRYAYAPRIFSAMKVAPYAFIVLILVLGSAYILLSDQHKLGLKWLSRDIFTSSATVIFAPIAFSYILTRYTSFLAPAKTSSDTQAIFDSVFTLLLRRTDGITIRVAGGWCFAAGLTWLLLSTHKPPKYSVPPLQSSEGIKKQKVKTNYASAPIQSSEDTSAKTRRVLQKKYKKIPKSVK